MPRTAGRGARMTAAVVLTVAAPAWPDVAGAHADTPVDTSAGTSATSAGTSTAPANEEAPGEGSTLTWSVRPTPTDAAPERPNFSHDLDPGTSVDDSIRVRNFGTAPLPLAIYASDAVTTSSGDLDLLPAGVQPTDVGAWIALDAATVEVPPQGFVDVPFTIAIPGNAESGDHVGGIVTSFRSPGTGTDGRPVVLDQRLGSRVQVRVGGELQPQLEISGLTISYSGTANPAGAGTLHVAYTVTNTGNVRLGAEQAIHTGGRFGLPDREATLEAMPELLPSSSLSFTAEVPDVWPAFRTKATVELTPVPTRDGDVFDPETPPATASSTTWTMPWAQLGVVVLLAALAAGIRWSRRRRRHREAARIDQAVRAALAAQEAPQPAPEPAPEHPEPATTAPGKQAGEKTGEQTGEQTGARAGDVGG